MTEIHTYVFTCVSDASTNLPIKEIQGARKVITIVRKSMSVYFDILSVNKN